jgi:predicted O-linked N-acetylglucosamine transferase (SPINDLY family)
MSSELIELARRGEWERILAAVFELQMHRPSVELSLWQVHALRALGRGAEANNILRLAGLGKIEADINVAVRLGEELLQAAFYTELEPLVEALEKKNHPAGYYLRSGLEREKANWSKAVDALKPLSLLSQPWTSLAKLALAAIRLRQGWLKDAETLLQPFQTDLTPATQKLCIRFEIASGQFEKSKVKLEQLAIRQPLDWEWPTLLSIVNASLGGDLEECLKIVDQGLLRQPRQAEAWALIVRINLSLGNEQNAKVAMTNALSIKPWLDAACLPFIERAAQARNFNEAENLLAQFRKLADTPRRQAAELDLVRMRGAKIRDLAYAAEALAKRFPDEPDVLRTAAAAFQSCRRKDPAALLLERASNFNPYDRFTRNNLAALYRERGDLEDAKDQWSRLVAEGDGVARINLIHILADSGDLFEADRMYREHLAVSSTAKLDPTMMRIRAEILGKQGELEKALAMAKMACDMEPVNSENWLLHAKIMSHLKGLSAANKVLSSAIPKVDAPLRLYRHQFDLLRRLLKPKDLVSTVQGWCDIHPRESEYLFLKASALQASLDWEGAEAAFCDAAILEPAEGVVALVRFYIERSRLGMARHRAEQWVRDDPSDIRRWAQLAEVFFMEEKPQKALEAVDQGLRRDPARLSLVRQKMGILLTISRYDEAIEIMRKQWQAKGERAAFMLMLDAMERALRFGDALIEVHNTVLQKPNDRFFRLRLARQMRLMGQEEESLAVLQRLFEEEPNSDTFAKALINSLVRLNRTQDASTVMHRFAKMQPDRIDLQVAIADIAQEQGLLAEARAALHSVRERAPSMLEAWLASCAVERREDDDVAEIALWHEIAERFAPHQWAAGAVGHWIRLGLEKKLQSILNQWRDTEPENVAPWWAAYEAARSTKSYSAALNLLEGITRRQGDTAKVLSERASIFSERWLMSDAIDCMKKAVEQMPSEVIYISQLIGLEVKAGNWDAFDKQFKRVEFLLGDRRFKEYENYFFNINCHPKWDAKTIYSYYQAWYEHVIKPFRTPQKPFLNIPDPERKLRIGYISPDFRQHAVAKFSEPILKAHDRERFTLYAYAHIQHKEADAWTERFKSYVDYWREIKNLSIDELERMIREDEIDILVDLAGHSANHRLQVFTRRPAPILASHVIGAGQTTGIPDIDYLVANQELWPEGFDDCASERVERLPVSGMVFSLPEGAPPPMPLPCLTRGYFTFGVFARPLRVSSQMVGVWAEILKKVPASCLRFEHQPYLELDIQNRYKVLFAENGIEAERLEFANTRPYWEAFHGVDLQLDPFPAGSGTTATEGLYMERLTVTLKDRPTMGRTAFSQLAALGLADVCVADNEAEYIDKAVALALDFDGCKSLSHGLRESFLKSPILDYKGYAEALANAYRRWWHEWCLGGDNKQ